MRGSAALIAKMAGKQVGQLALFLPLPGLGYWAQALQV